MESLDWGAWWSILVDLTCNRRFFQSVKSGIVFPRQKVSLHPIITIQRQLIRLWLYSPQPWCECKVALTRCQDLTQPSAHSTAEDCIHPRMHTEIGIRKFHTFHSSRASSGLYLQWNFSGKLGVTTLYAVRKRHYTSANFLCNEGVEKCTI